MVNIWKIQGKYLSIKRKDGVTIRENDVLDKKYKNIKMSNFYKLILPLIEGKIYINIINKLMKGSKLNELQWDENGWDNKKDKWVI